MILYGGFISPIYFFKDINCYDYYMREQIIYRDLNQYEQVVFNQADGLLTAHPESIKRVLKVLLNKYLNKDIYC